VYFRVDGSGNARFVPERESRFHEAQLGLPRALAKQLLWNGQKPELGSAEAAIPRFHGLRVEGSLVFAMQNTHRRRA